MSTLSLSCSGYAWVKMWSYKYTSSASAFDAQQRIGVRVQTSVPVSKAIELFTAASKEQVRHLRAKYSPWYIVRRQYGAQVRLTLRVAIEIETCLHR